jgi:hypothetical protein
LSQFGVVVESNGISAAMTTTTENSNNSGGGVEGSLYSAKWPSNKSLCECLLTLSATPNLTQSELESAALRCLLPANLARARLVDSNLFEKCVHKMLESNKSNFNLKLDELVRSQMSKLVELSLGELVLGEKELNSVHTLCRIDSQGYFILFIFYSFD